MRDWVNEWVQQGRLCVWRYADPKRGWRGWQVTADPAGCRSVRNLLDRMQGGGTCHRTWTLEPVTAGILAVPNYGRPAAEQFEKLRIEYRPEAEMLSLSPEGATVVLTVGPSRLRKLASAFAQVEVGDGDFGIETTDDSKADQMMFWWMPRQTSQVEEEKRTRK